MKKQEPLSFNDLMKQTEELGLLNSQMTLICVNCQSAFPYEYGYCPRCKIDEPVQDI